MTSRPLTPEGAVLKQIKDGLKARRVPHWRIGVGGFKLPGVGGKKGRFVKLGDPGLPDLVALVAGVGSLFIEVKAPDGKMSPEQVIFRDCCRAAGATHVVARSFADVEPWLTPRLRGGA